jgi:FtsP/CotA-like multicopper oxidase with cupredoxin domain
MKIRMLRILGGLAALLGLAVPGMASQLAQRASLPGRSQGAIDAPASAQLASATDVNPDPDVFEAYLTADEQDLVINGTTVHAMVYRDDPPGGGAPARIPGPEIKVKVGDLLLVHFRNDLDSESASIHWHGVELDNDSDGTAVTQDAVLPGQSYTYQFLTHRAGIFWYHPHMLPGSTTFAGMYGPIVIQDDVEAGLQGSVLPAEEDTHTLVLSDIEFDPFTGLVGKRLDVLGEITPINELIELCHLFVQGEPGGNLTACGSPIPGEVVLVNGRPPDPAAQEPRFVVASGQRIRLRLIDAAITRHFRLKLLGSGDNKLYRIGGEGGLLDRVVLEGGVKGTWNTLYDLGEIVIGSGERADVLVVPSGNEGDVVQLVGNPLPNPFNLSASLPFDYPLAYFEIRGTSSDTPPSAGDPILAGTAGDVENLKDDTGPANLVTPAPFGGSSDRTIRLTNARPLPPPFQPAPSIDGFSSMLDSNVGNGDFLTMERPPTSRYARVGDLLELSIRNETPFAVHPFHLHGFSMQPVRVLDQNDRTIYTFDYDEFVDSMDVYNRQTLVIRVRLDDRPKVCDLAPSAPPGPVLAPCTSSPCEGAVGRWLFHCHVFHHAGLGMMGELTVLAQPGSAPEITCPEDVTVGTDPGSCSAVVAFDTPLATDDCGAPEVVSDPPSGSVFPKGTTTVLCTATDGGGLTAQCSFDVTVEDREPPRLASTVAVGSLWPPSHELVEVGLEIAASDNCSAAPFRVEVFGDEDDDEATGEGSHSPDARHVASGTLRLRAERKASGDGRVYLIVVTSTDAAGNTARTCSTVVVPRNQGRLALARVEAEAAAARAFFFASDGGIPPGYFVIGDDASLRERRR